MKKFLHKIKNNNRALDVPILGTLIVMIFFKALVLQIDIFFATVTRAEMQTNIELAQVYALVKGVDIHSSRDGKLHINLGEAKKHFRSHFREHNQVHERSLIKEIITKEGTSNFVYIDYSDKSSYMFSDGEAREFIYATSKIDFVPRRIVKWNERPVRVFASTRIFLE